MDIDSRTGLVLEGGGMRAIFTVGVLDCFMDHDIWFPYTITLLKESRRANTSSSIILSDLSS